MRKAEFQMRDEKRQSSKCGMRRAEFQMRGMRRAEFLMRDEKGRVPNAG